MDHDGWTNAEAIEEMINLGYTAQHLDVLPYLRNYKPKNVTGSTIAPHFIPGPDSTGAFTSR